MGAVNFLSLKLSFVVLYLFGSSIAHNHFNHSSDSSEFEEFPSTTPFPVISRIVGGTSAQKNEFPWLVSIFIRKNNQIISCGGALIRLDAVLTAAHCVLGASPSDVVITAGEHIINQIESTEQSGVGKRVKWHENYNVDFLNRPVNDIAVIKLEQSLKETPSVQTIRLPSSSSNNIPVRRDQITVAGWGRTGASSPTGSNILRKVTIPVVPNLLCALQLRDGSRQFCAGRRGQSACAGDSGGPAICRSAPGQICGLVSYGTGCGAQFLPGVYNRVAPYLSWINEALKD